MRAPRLVAVAALVSAVLAGCSGPSPQPAPQQPTPLAGPEFRAAAALACTQVINHRRSELPGLPADQRLSIDALLLQMGRTTDSDPAEVAAASGRLAAEQRRTETELAKVQAADAADQQHWQGVIGGVRGQAEVYEKREQVITAGQYDRITPGETSTANTAALEALGLQDRDCRLLTL